MILLPPVSSIRPAEDMIDMVQQTKDSMFCEYSLENTETGLLNTTKQLSTSLSEKKTVLRDLQNENGNSVPKSSHTSADKSESFKTSFPKRSAAESLTTPLQLQYPMSNAGNGHLVYVRRKPDTEPGRSITCDNHGNGVDCSKLRETDIQDEATQKKSHVKEPKISTSETSSIPIPSSVVLSSARPTVSSSIEKDNDILPPANLNHLHASSIGNPVRVSSKQWEERYIQLQNLLKNLDQSDQNDYVQMLRSLSSVELSKHAVELEKRSIQLSLDEAKELQRVRILDVLERYSKHSRVSLTQQDNSQK